MKTKVLAAAVVTALLGAGNAFSTPIFDSAHPSLAGATLQDFNSAPLGGFAIALDLGEVTVYDGGYGLSVGDDVATGQMLPPYLPGDQHLFAFGGIDFIFDGTVGAFGIVLSAFDNPGTMRAVDIDGNILETLAIPYQVNNPDAGRWGFFGIAATGIARVEIDATSSDIFVADDLYYVPENISVPEPSSLALMGAALLGMAVSRRKRA